jgi:hypothetical protein
MGIVMQLLIEPANFRTTSSPTEWLEGRETNAHYLTPAGIICQLRGDVVAAESVFAQNLLFRD